MSAGGMALILYFHHLTWPPSLTLFQVIIVNLFTHDSTSHAHVYHILVLNILSFDNFLCVHCSFILTGIIPILRPT